MKYRLLPLAALLASLALSANAQTAASPWPSACWPCPMPQSPR